MRNLITRRMAVLMVLTAFAVVGANASATPITWYVDDDGTPGVDCDFNTIQEAIGAASDGDTIMIAAGYYTSGLPGIRINKDLTVKGAGPANTRIDVEGNGHGIYIDVDGVTLSDLFIEGAYYRNIVFYLADVSDILVDNVESTGAGSSGIEVHSSEVTNLQITHSSFHDNGYSGIRVSSDSEVCGLTIDDSDFIDNAGIGIYLIGKVEDLSISACEVTESGLHGAYIAWLDGGLIDGTHFEGNGDADNDEPSGIKISAHDGQPVDNLTIRDCQFVENGEEAMTGVGEDAGNGLLISSKTATSSGFLIEDCLFENNKHHGLIAYGRSGGSVTDIIVRGSTFAGHSQYGISTLYDGSPAAIVDALANWWGDNSGPYHPTTNPGGLGDEVSDSVLFDPWIKTTPNASEAKEEIDDNIEHKGTANSLKAKLDAAVKQLEKGNEKAAINILKAFINEVEAQKGKKIDADFADQLIEWAEAWIDDPSLAN
ncbi:nitrous oxide reductase family maturation protein NosD [Planctomycetota bacterium]